METIYRTIGSILKEISEKYPDNNALIHTEQGIRYSYSRLNTEIESAAKGLFSLGIKKGDKVAVWATNIPEWIVAQISLAKIGAILIPIDPGIDKANLQYILEQSEASGIIMSLGLEEKENIETLIGNKDNLPYLEKVILISKKSYQGMPLWKELIAIGEGFEQSSLEIIEDSINPEDPAAIMYTSGTTGNPKGVVLDHLGLINKSMCSTLRQGIDHRDRLCLFFPLFHMFGNTCITLAGLLRGSAIVMPCSTFEPSRILETIETEKCTAIYGSPSMIISLLDHTQFEKKKWKTVQKGILGGSPCPMELMKKLAQDIGVSDITVSYGITETSSWITMTHPSDPLELRVSTIGTPIECNEVKIVNPGTGEDLPPNTQGELCTKGFLMKEYFKMPAATSNAIDREGWFHSGDLGEMDEKGYFKITGRIKDVIIRNNLEIYPTEIEELIYNLPEISEAQVFGFPHPEKGQEIALWVKIKDGEELAINRLVAYVEENVDKEKRPEFYKIVNEFPMTRSGKIQKFRLAEMADNQYN